MKYLIIFLILVLISFGLNAAADENWTPDFKEFCTVYMKWVNKFKGINAGCCEINHPSNDIAKAGWKGETLLICDGKQIV